MDHKIQYSDIWISMAWAPLKKITGPADQRRAEFYWSTGSYSGHGLAVLLVCWQFQFYWTTQHTHRAGFSSPLCSFYFCCPYFISNADATTGSHYFKRLLQVTIRKLNSSPYTLQEEQTTLQELGKEDRYGYL